MRKTGKEGKEEIKTRSKDRKGNRGITGQEEKKNRKEGQETNKTIRKEINRRRQEGREE